ncbi:hypothetical protein AN161_21915 [Lysinibacillus sp. FJAT-14222]|nr:hypothetical protein AN161_21915 [Lysinibacillus sp. FJAT-14222]
MGEKLLFLIHTQRIMNKKQNLMDFLNLFLHISKDHINYLIKPCEICKVNFAHKKSNKELLK